MSQRRDDHQTSSPKLDVKLNLSPTPPQPPPPPDSPEPESATSSASSSSLETSSEMSINGSCVSSEAEQDQTSPDQSSSIRVSPMVLVGCPRCLMYVMLSDTNSKCPKCKSTVLLDFLNEEADKKTGTR